MAVQGAVQLLQPTEPIMFLEENQICWERRAMNPNRKVGCGTSSSTHSAGRGYIRSAERRAASGCGRPADLVSGR